MLICGVYKPKVGFYCKPEFGNHQDCQLMILHVN